MAMPIRTEPADSRKDRLEWLAGFRQDGACLEKVSYNDVSICLKVINNNTFSKFYREHARSHRVMALSDCGLVCRSTFDMPKQPFPEASLNWGTRHFRRQIGYSAILTQIHAALKDVVLI